MRSPEPDSHIALMAAVIGGVSLFTEPRESTAQKWLYWALAPAVAIVCISLVFKSVLVGLGLGASVFLFLAMTYLRYKL